MYRIGVDIGSTYTKYCIMDSQNEIINLFSEKTPIRQQEYFNAKFEELNKEYNGAALVSCGYGKHNINALKMINELTALACGAAYVYPDSDIILDIGGQDTKIIKQEGGVLKEFFINEKCAAGSGVFLSNVCNMLDKNIENIKLIPIQNVNIKLSSVCVVFAQSEIVKLIADNVDVNVIVSAVIKQILTQAKQLLTKIPCETIVLSGGLSEVSGIKEYAEDIFKTECIIGKMNRYLSAIGCTLKGRISENVILH